MADITSLTEILNEPDPDVVNLLAKLLEHARKGKIQGFSVVYYSDDGSSTIDHVGLRDNKQTIYLLARQIHLVQLDIDQFLEPSDHHNEEVPDDPKENPHDDPT